MSKHYVVWVGRAPGVYSNWPETQRQVSGFKGAKFKSFPSLEAANAAFAAGADAPAPATADRPTGDYMTVDAAFSSKTQALEWRGVLVQDGVETEVFRAGPYQGGSANVGEYLAIVQGIQYMTSHLLRIPLYSDSYNAQKWVREERHASAVQSSDALVDLLNQADAFLQGGGYRLVEKLIPLMDWNSRAWGEIPADFGRK